MSFKAFEYVTFRQGHIDLNWDGSLQVKQNKVRSQTIDNGMAAVVFDDQYYSSPIQALNYHLKPRYLVRPNHSKLYFSEGCRMRRDLFRNSGYQIVMNKDKADATVIPEPRSPLRLTFDIFTWCENTKTLTLYSVDEAMKYNTEEVKKTTFDRIKAALEFRAGEELQFFQDTILRNCNCWIIHKHPHYKEILEAESIIPFIYETDINIDYPINICPETLFMWSKMYPNSQEFRDAVCASDWVKYPATLLVFLKTEWGRTFDTSGASQMFRLVLNTIGFDYNTKAKEVLKDKNVTAEDWNMLQDYILYRLNLDTNGGPLDQEKLGSRDRDYLKWIRSALVVKPLRMTSDQDFNNIYNILV